ncbi:hypothetical protein FNAPI_3492 [Fusarium napiforme]|uniref:Uncharacterized protein n=1 Tax=Fusarium napiforme TaxID=42672 RepID=A0A8H5NE30_9HYPO|nr:hypothetical protein FNAPI_3492 [Fusarium napiforme]
MMPTQSPFGRDQRTWSAAHCCGIAPPPEGYMPETAPDLSVIRPGESLEADIVLSNPNHVFHQMVKNGGDIEISMTERWNGFWLATAPEQPYVSSEPNHFAPSHGEPETSDGNKPIYGDDSSRVSSDVRVETEATSRAEQSESTTSKDKAKSKESYTSGQSTTKSSEYRSPENETRYSSTDSKAAESPKHGSLPIESSEDTRSTGASLSNTEKVATTPAPFAVLQKRAEEPKATDAMQSWTTMASKTTKTVSPRLVQKDCRDKCNEDCKCKDY